MVGCPRHTCNFWHPSRCRPQAYGDIKLVFTTYCNFVLKWVHMAQSVPYPFICLKLKGQNLEMPLSHMLHSIWKWGSQQTKAGKITKSIFLPLYQYLKIFERRVLEKYNWGEIKFNNISRRKSTHSVLSKALSTVVFATKASSICRKRLHNVYKHV